MANIYKRVTKEVSGMTDGLGMPIDQGIKKTVIGLRVNKVRTVQSCEGHDGRVNNEPYVVVGGKESRELEERHTQTYLKVTSNMPKAGQPWKPQQKQVLKKLGGISALLEQKVKPQEKRVTALANEFNEKQGNGGKIVVNQATPGRVSLEVVVPETNNNVEKSVLKQKQGVMSAFGDFLLGRKGH